MGIVFLCICVHSFRIVPSFVAAMRVYRPGFFSGRSCRPVVNCSGCRPLIVSRDIGVVCNSWPGRIFVWYEFFFRRQLTLLHVCYAKHVVRRLLCQLNCIQLGHTRKVRGNVRLWNPPFSGFRKLLSEWRCVRRFSRERDLQ